MCVLEAEKQREGGGEGERQTDRQTEAKRAKCLS